MPILINSMKLLKNIERLNNYESAKKITYQNLAVDVMSHHSNGFYRKNRKCDKKSL